MSALGTPAWIRPDEWELPLFLHVLGALTLLGTLVLTSLLMVQAARGGSAANLRLGLRVFSFGVIPAWIVMRVAAEWIASEEGFNDVAEPPTWIDFGYIAGDAGLLFLIIAGVCGRIAYKRSGGEDAEPATTAKVAAAALCLMVVVNLVALWAMTTKPA